MFRSSNFDKLLDKATSNLRLEPDWPAILQICDLIRQGDYQPKYALAAIKKKLYNGNPHIALYGLLVLESCVKNCGNLIHDEIGTKQYMEQLRDLVKTTAHENVKNKVLELIQAWAYAFRNSPKYRAVQDTVNIMKTEGYKFPALKESDAMFSADTAPEWADGDCCHRCRVQFGMVQRKHHCRACGQVFCAQCSSRQSTLPKYGIEREVRVCEACYESLNNGSPGLEDRQHRNAGVGDERPSATSQKTDGELPPEYVSSSLAQQNQAPPRKTEEELREEEELQLALALSKSEAEHKEKEKKRTTSAMMSSASRAKQYSPPPVQDSSPNTAEEEDPELARYLNRTYWEQRQTEEEKDKEKHAAERDRIGSPLVQQPSAPINVSSPMAATNRLQKQENGETDGEIEEFVSALRSQVEIFVNRMKSNSSRGRNIANDSSVQTLFMNITAMHSRLLSYIQQQDDNRVYYEGLQDKLVQVKDARAALDALREEHREKLRRQAEEAERVRQMQMAQKLEITRKKKQEYLQYQRQMALQRIQEQEREMQMRQEQQKRQYMMGAIPYGMSYLPPGHSQAYIPATDNSPVHGQFVPNPMMQTAVPYPGMPPATSGGQGGPYQPEYPHYTVPGMRPPMPGQVGPPPGSLHAMSQGGMQGTIHVVVPHGPIPMHQGPQPQGLPIGPQGLPLGHQGPPQMGPQGASQLSQQTPQVGPQQMGPQMGQQGPQMGPQGPPQMGPQGPQMITQGPQQIGQQGSQMGSQGPPQMGSQGPPQMGNQGPPQMGNQGPPPMGNQGPPPMGNQGPPPMGQQGSQIGVQGPPQMTPSGHMVGPSPVGAPAPSQYPAGTQMIPPGAPPPQQQQQQQPPQQQTAPPGSPQQTAELISFD